jgi:hypothetical protein
MTGIGRNSSVAACVLAVSFLCVPRAHAWGALAFGVSPDADTTVSASVTGEATSAQASRAALAECRKAEKGSEEARTTCVVVSAFDGLCFAIAGSFWAIAEKEEDARKQVAAKCTQASCVLNSSCDRKTEKASPGEHERPAPG